MNLNEKALVKLMKNSYKAGGVKLLRTKQDSIVLSGGYWLLVIDFQHLPSTVLGLLAEWLRRLPEPGEALHCGECIEYGATPTIADEVNSPVLSVVKIMDSLPQILNTGISYHESCIVQASTGKTCGFHILPSTVCGNPSGGRLATVGDESWGIWEDIALGAVYCVRCEESIPLPVLAAVEGTDFYKFAGRKE